MDPPLIQEYRWGAEGAYMRTHLMEEGDRSREARVKLLDFLGLRLSNRDPMTELSAALVRVLYEGSLARSRAQRGCDVLSALNRRIPVVGKSATGRRRWHWTLLPMVALAVAGCGAAASFPSVSKAHPHTNIGSFVLYDSCLGAHGVAVPPGFDPYTSRGPKLNVTQGVARACAPSLPPPPPVPVAVRQEWTGYSQCMNQAGFTNSVHLANGGVGVSFAHGIGPLLPGFNKAQSRCFETYMHQAFP